MKIKQIFNNTKVLFAAIWVEIFILSVCAALSIYFLGRQHVSQQRLHRATEVRYQSFLLADRLRHSSDDLTRMVRSYVATGDPQFERFFWEILAIRNGEKPRPLHYNRAYWDFITVEKSSPPFDSGPAVSLETLMKDAGFTQDEFKLLGDAKKKSDKLVALEETAMHAMKGEFKDENGHYTVYGKPDPDMARSLVFGKDYHQAKKQIMEPINIFFNAIDQRTAKNVDKADFQMHRSQNAMTVVFVMLVLSGALFLMTVKRHQNLQLVALKQSEEKSKESEARLKEAQSIARLGNWELNILTNELAWSEEIYRIFEVEPTEFKASYEAFMETIHPEDRDWVNKCYRDSVEHHQPYYLDHRLLMKDGRIKYVHEQGQTDYDEHGRPVRSVGVVQDISAQKFMERELNTTQMHFKGFINSSIDPVSYLKVARGLKVDMPLEEQVEHLYHSVCVDANQAYGHAYGVSNKEELIGKKLIDILKEKSLNQVFADFIKSRYFMTNYDVSRPLPNGYIYFGLENWCGIVEQGELTNIWTISKNITERKLAEQDKIKLETQLRRAQKMEAIGTLAGGIAHDFNNILFPIIGYAEMLFDDIPESSPQREMVNHIYKGGQRARKLVKQLLAFSRETEQELMPLKVHTVVKEALSLVTSSLPSTIETRQFLSKECGLVLADATQLHQITMNLITNAFHAMEDSGGILEVELGEVELSSDDINDPAMKPGRYICLMVGDTGQGIQPRDLERIFDPYFTTKEQGKGTGLGLSIVHSLIKSYKGDIRVYSEVGKGTVFKVFLPVIESEIEQAMIAEPIDDLKGHERILIVDDEPEILNMEKKMLERLGYQVTVNNSGKEALEIFLRNPEQFDVIISDMTMPKMTGDILARKMLEVRPDIPIILCSGFIRQMSEEKAKGMGLKGFIMKPIIKREVARAIRKAVDEKTLT